MANDVKPWLIRFPAPLYADLRARYAATYNGHQLAFNAWLVSLIEAGAKAIAKSSKG